MKLTLIIPDNDYREAMSSGQRLRGSLGIINPEEVEFRRWKESPRQARQFKKLPHGRVSLTADNVRLTLNVDRLETAVDPTNALRQETREACRFIEDLEDMMIGY